MARVKFDLNKPKHERIPKNTSIGRRPKMSSMNKHKKGLGKNIEDKVDETHNDHSIVSYLWW